MHVSMLTTAAYQPLVAQPPSPHFPLRREPAAHCSRVAWCGSTSLPALHNKILHALHCTADALTSRTYILVGDNSSPHTKKKKKLAVYVAAAENASAPSVAAV